MTKHLLSVSPITGIRTYYEEGEGGKFHIHQMADVEGVLEFNKRQMTHHDTGQAFWRGTPKGEAVMKKVASVPMMVLMKWMTEYHIDPFDDDDLPKVIKLLNDPEWRWLKCADIIL